jgi:hypothetical protein
MPQWSSEETLTIELSFISMAGCWHADPAEVAKAVSSLMRTLLPRQEIVWGPAVHQPGPDKPGGAAKLSDALVLVCRDADTGKYYVVFRGTNTNSSAEWLLQDFMVQRQVPWLEIQPGASPERA